MSIGRMNEYHDKNRREEEFSMGDWVFLKLRPYRQKAVSQKAWYKLGTQFYGPIKVLEKIGQVAYKLNLPEESQTHPVIHVSQLKRRIGTGEVIENRLPAVTEEGKITFRPSKAVEYR